MSTRSTISIVNSDGTVDSVYCHFDGYKEGVGKTLLENYTERTKVKELISLGAMSSLAEHVVPFGSHSYDEPESGVTVFYCRDRGEDFNSTKYPSVESWRISGDHMGYDYIFQDNKWKILRNKGIVDLVINSDDED